MSDPRKLNSHATSSSMLTTTPAAFFSSICLRTAFNLSSTVFPSRLDEGSDSHRGKDRVAEVTGTTANVPEYLTSKGNTLFLRRAGLSFPHTISTGFVAKAISCEFFFPSDSFSSFALSVELLIHLTGKHN